MAFIQTDNGKLLLAQHYLTESRAVSRLISVALSFTSLC